MRTLLACLERDESDDDHRLESGQEQRGRHRGERAWIIEIRIFTPPDVSVEPFQLPATA